MTRNSEWLQGLKVGDSVALKGSIGNFQFGNVIQVIERETPKRWVLPYGKQVRKHDGCVVGAYAERIYPVTDEIRMEIRERKARRALRSDLKKIERYQDEFSHEQVNSLSSLLSTFMDRNT